MNTTLPNAQRTRCEVWTRVMGYHRPVSQYNVGKKSEFYSRVYFQVAKKRMEKIKQTYAVSGATQTKTV